MEWSEIVDNPMLKDLPFKIELNKFGKLVMTPASNKHGRLQGKLAGVLWNQQSGGDIIAECSIETSDGVKVADIAWASAVFIETFSYSTPYPKAPELCVEIVSPSNSSAEITAKVELYLAKGAQEVWVVYDNDVMDIYSHTGKTPDSEWFTGIRERLFR